ncbi:MAG: hypothetical protein Fur002_24140 [Anaerolineales bacterium]
MDFSLLAAVFDLMKIDPPAQLTLLDARTLTSAHVPPFPADIPALLYGFDTAELVTQIKKVLLAAYPKEHEATWVEGSKLKVESLNDLHPAILNLQPSTFLYIPSLGVGTSFESFTEIIAHLRAPDGCPWDKEQTHQTLRTHLLEEAYETLAAMDDDDTEAMREEFGDLLLQIVLNSQIAREEEEFTMTQVLKHVYDKIIRRHPHVFGDAQVAGVDGVLANWEKLKEKERSKKKENKGMLDGVPSALPALIQAQEYQDRAARVGFDWRKIDDVLDKVREEIEEVKRAQNMDELSDEIGDLFFVLVNLARWKKIDAESALRGTNLKFKKRFGHVEQSAKKQGRNLSDMTLEEMDAFWNEAKKLGM